MAINLCVHTFITKSKAAYSQKTQEDKAAHDCLGKMQIADAQLTNASVLTVSESIITCINGRVQVAANNCVYSIKAFRQQI